MSNRSSIWIGSVNGALVVHDKELQVAGSRWVAVFMVRFGRVDYFRRAHIRTVAQALTADHPERERCIHAYETWRGGISIATLEGIKAEIARRDAATAAKLHQTADLHAAKLARKGIHGVAVTELAPGASPRSSTCWSCHTVVSSDLGLECSRCKWVICGKCGSCSCDRY